MRAFRIFLRVASLLLAAGGALRAQPYPGQVSTLAGEAGEFGSTNGTGSAARFNYPWGVAVDVAGDVYVADSQNYAVRKITAAGAVTTFAGGTYGSSNGTGVLARFSAVFDVAVDANNFVYASDTYNGTIRKISPDGVVTTLAGLAGMLGSVDGAGSSARFEGPEGLAVDASGNIYVADTPGHTIRKITPLGVVTTIAGTAGAAGFANGTGAAARFNSPHDVAIDTTGNLYVADGLNNAVRRITPAGVVTTIASDGLIDAPDGVAIDPSGNLWIASTGKHIICVKTPTGLVTWVAGDFGVFGSADGLPLASRFHAPKGLAFDQSGNLFVADALNHTVRRVAATPSASDISISQQPTPQSVVIGASTTFTVAATHGIPSPLLFRWQRKPAGTTPWSDVVEGGTYSGASDATLTVTGATLAMSGDSFRCIVRNTIAPDITSTSATLTVTAGIVIQSQPVDTMVESGYYGSFLVLATGPLPLSYQWQVSTDGATWQDAVEAPPFELTTQEQVAVGRTTLAMSGWRFRAVVSDGVNPSVTSDVATLTVFSTSTPQTITFPSPPNRVYGSAPFVISATASSGLPVSFQIVSGPATLAGTTITLTGVGTVTIRASQAGDATYDAAPDIDRSFDVTPAPAIITLGGLAQTYAGAPRPVTATTTPAGLAVSVTYGGSTIAPTRAGTYAIVATVAAANYAGSASGALVVAPAPLTVLADDKTRVEGLANPPLTISYAGFVAGETAAVLDALPIASTTADIGSPPGTYAITLTGGVDTDYSITRTDGTLVVTANTGIAIATFPEAVTVLPDDEARFEVQLALLSGVLPQFHWQRSLDGGANWTEVVADANHAGVTTSVLTVSGTRTTMIGWDYRVIVSDGGLHPTATSGPARLHVFNVVTRAGSNLESGSADGPAAVARFESIRSIAIDGAGNAYVADTDAHTVRMITPAGDVSTLAGLPGSSGSADGVGPAARFGDLQGIAVTKDGLVYVADTSNRTIRRIAPDGTVTTYAGAAGQQGYIDGPAATARFTFPKGIVVDELGEVLVLDGSTLRRIDGDRAVSSMYLWRDPVIPADGPNPPADSGTIDCVEVDEMGYIYVGGYDRVHRIAPDGRTVRIAGGADEFLADGKPGGLGQVLGLAVDRSGYVYVSDDMGGDTAIRKISPSGTVETITSRSPGYRDGLAAEAQVSYVADLAIDERGRVQFVDTANLVVRALGFDPAAPTVAASPESVVGIPQRSVTFTCDVPGLPPVTHQWQRSVDAGMTWGDLVDDEAFIGSQSAVLTLTGVTRWMEGHQFRDIAANGAGDSVISASATLSVAEGYSFLTYAGVNVSGVDTPSNGRGDLVALALSGPIATDGAGGLYIAGFGTIAHVSADGYVSPVWTGPGFDFMPRGLAVGTAGDLLIANNVPPSSYPDLGSQTAFVMSRSILGEFSLVAGGALGSADGTGLAAEFTSPQGIAVTADGTIVVADTEAATIRRIAPTGEVVTLAGTAYQVGSNDGAGGNARFSGPSGVAVDASGIVYVVDRGTRLIRKITPAGVVTTWTGGGGAGFDEDAVGTAANFYAPAGIAVDASGNAFVTDQGALVRRIAPDASVTTLGGAHLAIESRDGFSTAARFSDPTGIAVDPAGRLFIADPSAGVIRLGVRNAYEAIITTSPADVAIVPGGDATFSVGVDGTRPIRVTWEKSVNGGDSWTEAGRDALYGPVGTATLTLSGGALDLNGMRVRATVTNGLGTPIVSAPAVIGTQSPDLFSGSFTSPPAALAASRVSRTGADAVAASNSPSGDWALYVRPDRSATFLAYLPQRSSALFISFSVAIDGSFSVDGTEQRAPGLPPADFTLTGQISGGSVTGQIAALGLSFAGPAEVGTGLFTTTALNGSSGAGHLVVGANGTSLFVVAAATYVDGGVGTVDANGEIALGLSSGATVSGSVGAGQGVSLTLAPAGGGAVATFAGFGDGVTPVRRLVNISTRGFAGTGGQVMIAGFVISGSAPKQVLIRAVGPGLAVFLPSGEQADVLADPRLDLYRTVGGVSTLLAQNDDWQSTPNDRAAIDAATTSVGAFPLAAGSRDAALLATFEPGIYTAIASGASGGTGVTLVEAYEMPAPTDAAPRLINISTRGQVNTGNAIMIAGFVVTGNAPKQVLIRGVGPGLAPYLSPTDQPLVLADPRIELFEADGTPITANDDWGAGDATLINAAITATGAFPLPAGSKDGVLLLHLAPGRYTVHVTGVGGTTGIALAEIYEIP